MKKVASIFEVFVAVTWLSKDTSNMLLYLMLQQICRNKRWFRSSVNQMDQLHHISSELFEEAVKIYTFHMSIQLTYLQYFMTVCLINHKHLFFSDTRQFFISIHHDKQQAEIIIIIIILRNY